jgi:hypothetical protein
MIANATLQEVMLLLTSSLSNVLGAKKHMQIEYCGKFSPGPEWSTEELKDLNQHILSANFCKIQAPFVELGVRKN